MHKSEWLTFQHLYTIDCTTDCIKEVDMQVDSFVDDSCFGDAFVGNKLARLVDLIVDQGDALLKDAGLCFPSRAASTILLIDERVNLSAADIAMELSQPHQLATQRVEALTKLGLLERRNDPKDARRKTLSLTTKGKKEAALLKRTLNQAQQAFQNLYKEIEVNLGAVAIQSISALKKDSLSSRIEAAARAIDAEGPDISDEKKRSSYNV
jgi:DNA-binding MarR family transcriptional regulator